MKKIISLIMCIMLTFTATAVFAEQDITVVLDGQTLEFDVQPVLKNDRTMVPMRLIFEKLGATVTWEDETKRVEALFDDGTHIILHIDNTTAYKNGNPVVLDSAPFIESDRTMVPLRFVAESSGARVGWNNDTYTVTITPQWYVSDFIPFGEFMTVPSPLGASSDFVLEIYDKTADGATFTFDMSKAAKEDVMRYKRDLINKGFKLQSGIINDDESTFENKTYVLKTAETEDNKLIVTLNTNKGDAAVNN